MEGHNSEVEKPIWFWCGVIVAIATIVFVEIAEIVLLALHQVHFCWNHLQIWYGGALWESKDYSFQSGLNRCHGNDTFCGKSRVCLLGGDEGGGKKDLHPEGNICSSHKRN